MKNHERFDRIVDAEEWAVVVGCISVVVAVWAVFVAHRANGRAEHANVLAKESNRIAEEALEHQKLRAPDPWGEVEELGDRRYRVTNRSGRAINVLELAGRPHGSGDAVHFRSEPGSLIGYGDSLYFSVEPSIAQDPREIEVAWVYSDDTSMEWEYLYRNIPAG